MEGTVEEYRAAAHDWQRLCAEKQRRIEELEAQIENLRLLRRTKNPKPPTVVERGFYILSCEGDFQGHFSTIAAQKQANKGT